MCIIIYQDAGMNLGDDKLHNAWSNNPDGGGFAYLDESGQPHVEKYMTWTSYITHLRNAKERYGETSPFVLHMRIKTHGRVCVENTHPFFVSEDTVMAHNGIISGVSFDDSNKSDTRHFIEQYVQHLPDDWLDNKVICRLVEDFIGTSKLVFLSGDPELDYKAYILNARAGHWMHDRDGAPNIWFSNTSYKRKKFKSNYTTKIGGATVTKKKGKSLGKDKGSEGGASGSDWHDDDVVVAYADDAVILYEDGRLIEKSYPAYYADTDDTDEEVESSLSVANRLMDSECFQCEATYWECQCGGYEEVYTSVLMNHDITAMTEDEVDELIDLATRPMHSLTEDEWMKVNGYHL